MGETSALSRPARATVETTERLADWLAQGCIELKVPRISVSFHGGEPMLLRPMLFSRLCGILRDRLLNVADLSLSIQTNGTIFNDEWLEVFRQNGVSVGVSIDGNRIDNDRFRLDHRGRSTFDAVEGTIKLLVSASEGKKSLLPSCISVLDVHVDYQATYNYIRNLGIECMHFLLPDRNGDDELFRHSEEAKQMGIRLLEIFLAWLEENDPKIRVRFIEETLRHFRVGIDTGQRLRRRKDVQVLIVRSDGSVAVDDSYIPALTWYATAPVYSIRDHTVREVLSDPIFTFIEGHLNKLPDECRSCRWQQVCRGGDLENRFKTGHGFNNPSIYCESYKVFYSGVCDALTENGYPADEITKKFGT